MTCCIESLATYFTSVHWIVFPVLSSNGWACPLCLSIISLSTIVSENQVTIKVPDIGDKISLLSRQNTSPVPIEIENHTPITWAAFEKVHSSFCKFVLGVSKFSSNYAVLGELGRLPIEHRITVAHILYWLRLEKEIPGSLLRNAFNECKSSQHDFYTSVLFTLSYLGLPDILRNPHAIKESYLKRTLNMRLRDQYIQSFRQKLNSFENMKICKGDNPYEPSQYLDTVKNVKLRNIFTRLRTNENKLQAYLHKEELNCEKCKVPETTKHFLFDCKRQCIVDERERFSSQIAGLVPSYVRKSTNQKLRFLLDIRSKNDEIVKIICHHVNSMYTMRFKNPSCRTLRFKYLVYIWFFFFFFQSSLTCNCFCQFCQ